MTVAHKNLTGTDLHELKGASTATVGQVPVATGAGGTTFNKLTHTSLQTTGNPFGGQLLHVREEQLAGVDSVVSTSASVWVTSPLNTVLTNEISGASVAGNIITLPAGTYFIDAFVVCLVQGNSTTTQLKGRLANQNTGAMLYGPAVLNYSPTATFGVQAVAPVRGRFTLGGANTLTLDQYRSHAGNGQHISVGTEVYSEVLIWKVA